MLRVEGAAQELKGDAQKALGDDAVKDGAKQGGRGEGILRSLGAGGTWPSALQTMVPARGTLWTTARQAAAARA
jgi:hypothetical protein